MDILHTINIWGVILAALAYFMLGAAWFTPLFGKAYDAALGVARNKKQKWPLVYYIGPLISAVVTAIAVAVLISWLNISSVGDAVKLGLIVGVGVVLSVSCNNAINPVTPRPLLYGIVTGGYHVVGIVLCAVVVSMV